MGSGFLHVLGGAMQGLGQGMATQAAEDWRMRREAALQKIKGEYDLAEQDKREKAANALADKQQGYARENIITKGVVDVQVAEGKAPIERATYKAKSEVDEARLTRLENLSSNNDVKEKLAAIEAEYRAKGKEPPEVTDTVTDGETGAVSIIYSDGTSRILDNIIARPKPSASSGGGSESVVSLRGGSGGAPAPKPAPEPKPKQALRARENSGGGGTPRMATDAQADAFARDPANKGKSFVGPDGKRYTIPK